MKLLQQCKMLTPPESQRGDVPVKYRAVYWVSWYFSVAVVISVSTPLLWGDPLSPKTSGLVTEFSGSTLDEQLQETRKRVTLKVNMHKHCARNT